jgi:HSP20 family protein
MRASPFGFIRRLVEDMDELFDDFFGSGGMSPRIELSRGREFGPGTWTPQIEVFERNGQIVVHADLPGLTKDDVQVELGAGELCISGNRRQEHEDRREGYYRSERRYGSFCRTLAIPEGVDPDQMKAKFENGVLEITMPNPEPRTHRRRIDIQGGGSERREDSKAS